MSEIVGDVLFQAPGAVPAPLSFDEVVNRKSLGQWQLAVLAICLLAQMVDGFDNQSAAFVAPVIAGKWHLARGLLGPVFGAGAFGTLVGSLVIGPIGDVLGRKTLIVISLALAAVLMATTSLVSSIGELTLIRFLTGLPLGALIPGTVVIANEWAPTRGRAGMVTIMGCGFALGAVLGGLLSSLLMPRFGWAMVFEAGAGATAIIGLVALVWMPESLGYLSSRSSGKAKARAEAILRRFDPQAVGVNFTVAQVTAGSRSNLVQSLFLEGRAATTALLWAAFFMNLLVLNFMNNWLPTMLASGGMGAAAAVRTSTLFQVGGIVGVVFMGSLAARLGTLKLVIGGFLGAAVVVALVGLLAGGGRNAAIAAAGFCVIGSQASLAAVAAGLYPTRIRSTGTSWAQGFGRLGSTVGPLIGGLFVSLRWSTTQFFVSIAIFSICGFLAALLLTRQIGKTAPTTTLV